VPKLASCLQIADFRRCAPSLAPAHAEEARSSRSRSSGGRESPPIYKDKARRLRPGARLAAKARAPGPPKCDSQAKPNKRTPHDMAPFPRSAARLRGGQPCDRTVVTGSEFCVHPSRLAETQGVQRVKQGPRGGVLRARPLIRWSSRSAKSLLRREATARARLTQRPFHSLICGMRA
jgi:hypothetical protein